MCGRQRFEPYTAVMHFRDIVRKRRMVRSFRGDPVDPAALERILNAARRGPSAGFSQGVEFCVVTDLRTRATLGPSDESLAKAGLHPFVAQAPVAVVVCTSEARYTARYAEPDKARARAGRSDEEHWLVPYWHVDAGAAIMLLLLAVVDEGLSAGLVGVMGAEGQVRVRRAVGMPDTHTAVAIIAIGHSAEDQPPVTGSPRRRPRRPLADIVHRERW